MPGKLIAGCLVFDTSIGVTNSEKECDGRVAATGVGLDESGGCGRSVIGISMPGELITSNDILDTAVGSVDGEVESDDRVAPEDVGFCEGG